MNVQDQEAAGSASPLSAAVEERIRAEVGRYPQRRTGLLPALKIAQEETHFLPPPVIARVADMVGVSHASANELVTFYSMLRTKPLGTTVVEVCAQLPCALRGADELLGLLAAALEIEPGDTTPNGAVTLLRSHECFGACNRAPMCVVNDEYRENLRGKALEAFLAEVETAAGLEGQTS